MHRLKVFLFFSFFLGHRLKVLVSFWKEGYLGGGGGSGNCFCKKRLGQWERRLLPFARTFVCSDHLHCSVARSLRSLWIAVSSCVSPPLSRSQSKISRSDAFFGVFFASLLVLLHRTVIREFSIFSTYF
jgi:hypothetical protein